MSLPVYLASGLNALPPPPLCVAAGDSLPPSHLAYLQGEIHSGRHCKLCIKLCSVFPLASRVRCHEEEEDNMRTLSDDAPASSSVVKGRRREGKHVVVVVTCLGVCASDLRCREGGTLEKPPPPSLQRGWRHWTCR